LPFLHPDQIARGLESWTKLPPCRTARTRWPRRSNRKVYHGKPHRSDNVLNRAKRWNDWNVLQCVEFAARMPSNLRAVGLTMKDSPVPFSVRIPPSRCEEKVSVFARLESGAPKSWLGQPRMTQVRLAGLTVRRAELSSANNPPVYPGAQGE
jgi:hypothetical protein